MDNEILAAAQKYTQFALTLPEIDADNILGSNIEPELQSALLAVYYATKLEDCIENTSLMLTEKTGSDAVEALTGAMSATEQAIKDAMIIIRRYMDEEPEFAKLVDSLSVTSPSDNLYTELLKLYKSKSIITTAYGYASAHSYSATPEEFIMQHMDIDIDKILDIQLSLVNSIDNMLENHNSR
ncbi:MAG: hypothetical protein WDA65_02125 [Christensenellales bacterium]